MRTIYHPQHVVLLGKAKDVFKELATLAKWEKFGIGYQCYTISTFCLN